MAELPEITIYLEALHPRVVGQPVEEIRLGSPFLLRTTDPPPEALYGRVVTEVRRLGKRLALGVEGNFWMVLHLMNAGRLHWRSRGASLGGKRTLLGVDFPTGTLLLTETGSSRRASLHLIKTGDLPTLTPTGLDPLNCTLEQFSQRLRLENRTLKRALTAPHLLSGIGNVYADEILHAAQLSPVKLTHRLSPDDTQSLFEATRQTLWDWITRWRLDTGDGFPEQVTTSRKGLSVHGRYGLPCPVCHSPVQRIRFGEQETNYCATCQTDGEVLADRSLSRLLKQDWPRRIEDWE